MEEYGMFLEEFIEATNKNLQVQYLRDQIKIAEAVRIASCKKTDYISWVKAKERAIWKLAKTEEQKEAESLKAWDKLVKNQQKVLTNDKPKKNKGFLNKFKRR